MNTYALVIHVEAPTTITVGALGTIQFPEGYYTYIGSARSDNFSRVDRHKRTDTGDNDTQHWHIDYLLSSPYVTLEEIFKSHSIKESDLAESIQLNEIDDFGSSDTDCTSHLKYSLSKEELTNSIKDNLPAYTHTKFR